MNETFKPWVHPMMPLAVPMIGVDRHQFIERIRQEGFMAELQGPSGMYFRHPTEECALWVSWEWQQDSRTEWFTEIIRADKE